MTNGGGRVLPLRILIRTFVCAAGGGHRPDVQGEIKYNQKHYDYGNFNTEVCEPAVGLGVQGAVLLFCDPKNKQDLIALLNAFLPPERRVSDLEYASTELPGVTLSNKASRVDLRCTDEAGGEFIVEVQRGAQPHFFRRCVYYASRIYALGSERGDRQRYDLPPVYLIALTDRDFGFGRTAAEWEGRYTARYTFRERESGQVEEETISIIFVELYRFGKHSYEECGTDEERWCWTLKNMGRMEREPGSGATLMLPELEHLLESGRIAGFGTEKRAKYDADMITERDMYNILETAKEEGFAEGKAKGKAEIARKMLAAGMPAEQITEFTGLTAEQLAALK